MSAARGIPETVLVAPDSFKGTFTAAAVAGAVGAGLREEGWPIDLCPLADGGEGTAAAIATALDSGGEGAGSGWQEARVQDALGRPVVAAFWTRGELAVLDCAAASGLTLVAEAERDAVAASSYGTGELIAAAVSAGARRVLLGAGGSATTDGGAGALAALRATGVVDAVASGEVALSVLCDVRTPWERAAEVFSPQKGASPAEVTRLAERLDELAGTLPRDPRGVSMTGAAGGLAGGLWSATGAELVSGAAYVLQAVGFDARMRAAFMVITGEGRLDRQSLAGKVVSEAATRARQAGVPSAAVVGQLAMDDFGLRVLDIGHVLEASTLEELRAAGAELGRRLRDERARGR